MSRENMERARELVDAWNRRDARRLAALSHPEGEWLLPRNLLEGGSYRGPGAAERMLADAADMWEDVRVEIEDIRAVGDRVVILSRSVNVAKDGGPRVEYQSGHVLDFQDGKIIRFRPYLSHTEALEAVGLREQVEPTFYATVAMGAGKGQGRSAYYVVSSGKHEQAIERVRTLKHPSTPESTGSRKRLPRPIPPG